MAGSGIGDSCCVRTKKRTKKERCDQCESFLLVRVRCPVRASSLLEPKCIEASSWLSLFLPTYRCTRTPSETAVSYTLFPYQGALEYLLQRPVYPRQSHENGLFFRGRREAMRVRVRPASETIGSTVSRYERGARGDLKAV